MPSDCASIARRVGAASSYFLPGAIDEVKKYMPLILSLGFLSSHAWSQHSSPAYSLSTTALSFNGSSGAVSKQPITITSTGQRSLVLQSLSFSNSAFSSSSVSLPVTLSKGQSLTFQVVAQPATTASTGSLTFATNASRQSTVSLTETASQAQAAHRASLSWNKPTAGDNVVAYDVDRTVAGGTSYSQVGSTPGAQRTWTDTSVQSGKSYVYRVRSVDAAGTTSSPSGTVTLSIP
jgi:hypothetical protein